MATTYLAGPIHGCTDEQAKGWRELCKGLLVGPTRDPMDRDYRGREDECWKEIVENDLVDIRQVDVVLASYNPPGIERPFVGTSMEIFFAAHVLGIPVVFVAKEDQVISPWIRYHSARIVHSYEDACQLINGMEVNEYSQGQGGTIKEYQFPLLEE